MKFKTMPARRRDIGIKTRDMQEGDFVWVDVIDPPYMVYRPPGFNMTYTVLITTDRAKQDRIYWWWNGDRDKPTLQPSLHIVVPGTLPHRWHGYLVDGVLEACE